MIYSFIDNGSVTHTVATQHIQAITLGVVTTVYNGNVPRRERRLGIKLAGGGVIDLGFPCKVAQKHYTTLKVLLAQPFTVPKGQA